MTNYPPIYVLRHEEWDYDYGSVEIRGISFDYEQLRAAQFEKEPDEIPDRRYKSGFRKGNFIHDESCCIITEHLIGAIDA